MYFLNITLTDIIFLNVTQISLKNALENTQNPG
jgi:hypothetical protein